MGIMPELPAPKGFGRGWASVITFCPACGQEWIAEAPMGILEIPCPNCQHSYHEPKFEFSPLEPPNDGAWLTGSLIGDWPT